MGKEASRFTYLIIIIIIIIIITIIIIISQLSEILVPSTLEGYM